MRSFILLLISILILFLLPVSAQNTCNEFVWPDDPADHNTAKSMMALYEDALKENNLKAAVTPHRWFLENYPEFNLSLYINGAKIYNGLAESTEIKQVKMNYVDSLMIIYDMRKDFCNNAAEVAARKAYDHYRHTIRETDRLTRNLELFDIAYELNGKDISAFMILPYMNIMKYNRKLTDNLTLDGVIERYELVEDALTLNADKEGIDKIRDASENIFLEILGGETLDCAMIKDKLGKRYHDDPENMKKAKLVFSSLLKAKCTDDPLFLETGSKVAEEGGFKINYTLGQLAFSKGDIEGAEVLFRKALEKAVTNEDISDVHLRLGMIKKEQGFKPAARELFNEAIQANPSNREAYSAIGILYYESYEQCRQFENKVLDRTVFLAAYEKFMEAGDSDRAAMARSQFPSKVDIFEREYEIGQELNTDCWMKENVVLKARD